jgi:hypothetical protein
LVLSPLLVGMLFGDISRTLTWVFVWRPATLEVDDTLDRRGWDLLGLPNEEAVAVLFGRTWFRAIVEVDAAFDFVGDRGAGDRLRTRLIGGDEPSEKSGVGGL